MNPVNRGLGRSFSFADLCTSIDIQVHAVQTHDTDGRKNMHQTIAKYLIIHSNSSPRCIDLCYAIYVYPQDIA